MCKLRHLCWMLCLFVIVNTSCKTKTPKKFKFKNYFYCFLNLIKLFLQSIFLSLSLIKRETCSYFLFLIWTPFVFPEIGTPSLVHVIDGSGLADRIRHRNCNFLPTLTFLALIFFNSGFLPENEGKKKSLSKVRPKEFTYFLKITFGIVTIHPLPITPFRSLCRNYVLIKQMTVMHIKQITKFCSNKHDINSSFFFSCQLATVDVAKRVERVRETDIKSWTNWYGIKTGVILLISGIVLQICYRNFHFF